MSGGNRVGRGQLVANRQPQAAQVATPDQARQWGGSQTTGPVNPAPQSLDQPLYMGGSPGGMAIEMGGGGFSALNPGKSIPQSQDPFATSWGGGGAIGGSIWPGSFGDLAGTQQYPQLPPSGQQGWGGQAQYPQLPPSGQQGWGGQAQYPQLLPAGQPLPNQPGLLNSLGNLNSPQQAGQQQWTPERIAARNAASFAGRMQRSGRPLIVNGRLVKGQ